MTTPNQHQDHGEVSEQSTERTGDGPEGRRAPPWSRGGVLTLWIILGAMLGGAVGLLLGQALPGDFAYAGAIGLGAGIALGAAVGSRRADANDREIVRRAEEEPGADGL